MRTPSTTKTFAVYAAASLVLVVVFGVVLAASYRTEARRRGVAEGGPRPCSWPRRPSSPSPTGDP
ncbi:MAG TPA: hypothetical protein VMF60_09415 [Acidimicrobiales bacterium]|nr:hypothetical protein [Acidimicrobiales bacterium]